MPKVSFDFQAKTKPKCLGFLEEEAGEMRKKKKEIRKKKKIGSKEGKKG